MLPIILPSIVRQLGLAVAGKYSHTDRKVTKQMYSAAKNALEERAETPKSKRGGLDPAEARKQGIDSGVTRARQIVSAWKNNKPLSFETWRKVAAFSRFDNRPPSTKIRQARGLWGGKGGTARARKIMKQKKAADKSK